jgi:hypothetical protein
MASGYAMDQPISRRKSVCRDEDCVAYGMEHPGCVGHTGRGEERRPCASTAIVTGTTRCRAHGGAVKQVRAQGEARALALDLTYGDPIEISPAAALLEELYRTRGHVEWLSQRIGDLNPDTLVWGDTRVLNRPAKGEKGAEQSYDVEERTEGAELNLWLQLYRDERKHLVEVSRVCLNAGIEERKMKVIEAQAVILAQVIQSVLNDTRLEITAPPSVQSAVVREAMQRMELVAA